MTSEIFFVPPRTSANSLTARHLRPNPTSSNHLTAMQALTFPTSFLPLSSYQSLRTPSNQTSPSRSFPRPHATRNWLTAPYLRATIQSLITLHSTTAIFSPLLHHCNPQKTMFRRLRQSAGQASKIAWLEDQENNQDEWRRTKRKKNEAANFTGTWRLNASESDSLWFICHKLGCPMYVLALFSMTCNRVWSNQMASSLKTYQAAATSLKSAPADRTLVLMDSRMLTMPINHIKVRSSCVSSDPPHGHKLVTGT